MFTGSVGVLFTSVSLKYMFTGSVRVLLTGVSLKLKTNLKYNIINSHRGSELTLVGVE